MSYTILASVATLASVVVFLFAKARIENRGGRVLTVAMPFVALSVMTVIFDNIMIGLGLFDYGAGSILGFRIGLMPIEDLAYPAIAVLLLSAMWGDARER